ncbi:MAG: integrase family protein [Osedax symbiont Rs2]|nr:MAG: integrase family protein [Osedax symbiont Rs2]
MSVKIIPKGKITFQIRYRLDGKAKRGDLGTYPLLSLKDAREGIGVSTA